MESLRRSRDFKTLFSKGRKFFFPHLKIYFRENGLQNLRLGIVVRKKFGNAVMRNRVKRVVRETFRLHPPKKSFDVMVIFKEKSGLDPYEFSPQKFKKMVNRALRD